MKVNFQNIEDVEDYSPLPDGQYLCQLIKVEEAFTHNADPLWKLRFEVVQGPHTGRFIFDNMVFSERAMKRVKLICYALGLDTSLEVELIPDLILERHCYVKVVTEEYVDNEGNTKCRNSVPFAGYVQVKEEDLEITGTNDGEGGKDPF